MCRRTIWTMFLLVVFCSIAHAQNEGGCRCETQVGVGSAAFPDEGANNHVLLGGIALMPVLYWPVVKRL